MNMFVSLNSVVTVIALLLAFVLLGTCAAVLQRMRRRIHATPVAVCAYYGADGNLIGAFQVRDDARRPAPFIAGGDLLVLINALGSQRPGWSVFTGYLVHGSNPAVWVDLTTDCPFDHISVQALSLASWLTQFSATTSKGLVDAVRVGLLQVDLVDIAAYLALNTVDDWYYAVVAVSDGSLSLQGCSDSDIGNGCRHYGPGGKACTGGAFCPRPHIVQILGGRVVNVGVPLSTQ